ncbi:MAG: PaaI family thioesterase [Acidimicrobiia bacterium]
MEPNAELDPENVAARERLADAIRALNHALVGHLAPTETVSAAAGEVEALVDRLRHGPRRVRDLSRMADRYLEPLPHDGDLLLTSPERPFAGPANPYGIPLEVWYRAPWVETELVLGAAYEGAPGRSHGGVVAAIFDDLTGFCLSTLGVMAYTGRLTVDYLAGVPLDVPVTFRARVESRSGRKIVVKAEGTHGEARLAEAEALFIQIPSERLGLPAGLRTP